MSHGITVSHGVCMLQTPPCLPGHARARKPLLLAVSTRATLHNSPATGMPAARQIAEEESQYILQTYARPADVVLTHGEGVKVWDANGRMYLDFAAGIAVNALGHSDPRWYQALVEQAAVLAHTSNLFHSVPQVCRISLHWRKLAGLM